MASLLCKSPQVLRIRKNYPERLPQSWPVRKWIHKFISTFTRGSTVQIMPLMISHWLKKKKSCYATCFWGIRISKAANVSPCLVVDNLDNCGRSWRDQTLLLAIAHWALGLGGGTPVLSGRVKCTFRWDRAYPIRRKASFPGARGGLSCSHAVFSIHAIRNSPNIKSLP